MKGKKIWLCGQVAGSGEIENIKELVKTSKWFDGLCFCVNYKNELFDDDDGTFELLRRHKGNGRILRANFVNLHSFGMTMAVQCGVLRDGDWITLVDAQEIPKIEFFHDIRDKIKQWESEGIGSIWWGRPLMFIWNSQITFQPFDMVHCMAQPLVGKALDIRDDSKVRYEPEGVHFGDYMLSKKKLDNTMLLSAAKYYLCYNLGNEVQNQYGKFGAEIVNQLELRRQQIRRYFQDDLNIDLSDFNGFIEYCKKGEYTHTFSEIMEDDYMLTNIFRFFVLKQTRDEILKNRYNWSWKIYQQNKIYQNNENINQENTDYVGFRNQLNLKFNFLLE